MTQGDPRGSRKVFAEGRICVHTLDPYFPVTQDEPYKDREANWRQAWLNYVKLNGLKVCAITNKLVEEMEERYEGKKNAGC